MSDATSRAGGKGSGRRKPNASVPERRAASWADSALVAELSQRALTQTNLSIVMQEACELVSRRLGTEFVKILELVPTGEGLLLTAGIGWKPGYVGQVVVPLVAESHAGYTMRAGEPVVVEDLRSEKRFPGMPLLHEHGIVSGVSTIVRSGERTFGIMTAHTTERRSFTSDDVAFLTSVAGVVGAAIDRRQTEQALRESDERLRLAMDAGGMGAWEWNLPTGRVIWSETLQRIHRLEPGEFSETATGFFEFVHPDDRAEVQQTIARALNIGYHEIEYRVVLKDGSVRWLTSRGALMRDDQKRPGRMIGVCMDITERKFAEQALLAARAEAEAVGNRQAFLAEASTILSSSLETDVTLSSLARLCVPFLADWCAIDLIEDGVVRRVIVVHSDPEKLEFALRLQEQYPPDPNSPEVEVLLREGRPIFLPEIPQDLVERNTRDGEHREVIRGLGLRSAIGVPLKAGGRTIGILSLVTAESGRTYTEADVVLAEDIGQRAGLAVENAMLFRTQQEIGEELRRANEAKDEFLGLVSHELRTPITTIFGGARLLRTRADTIDEESRKSLLEDIEHESERLHRIVEDLLVLARVELGEEVQTEPVLIQRLVEKTVSAFKKRRRGRTFVVDLDDDMQAARASNVYLDQILRNLVNNADKYSPPETEIEVRAREIDGEAVISVMDRGPGIPAEELELIFERFYRSRGTAKQAGGAGIGLTVCRRLVEAQNGRIWAEPREGGGLIVSFSLPRYEDLS